MHNFSLYLFVSIKLQTNKYVTSCYVLCQFKKVDDNGDLQHRSLYALLSHIATTEELMALHNVIYF